MIRKKPSPGAKAQQTYRGRMRQQGLVPRQVYIRLEHKEALNRLELLLRKPVLPFFIHSMESDQAMRQPWTTQSLYEALVDSEFPAKQDVDLQLVDGVDPAIAIEMREHGDLRVHMAVSGDQIFVSTPLCRGNQIADRNAFNEACLRLNPLNPLSNLGLQSVDGEDVYIIFGELSSRSPLANVIEEIVVLAHNTLQAAEAFDSYLR